MLATMSRNALILALFASLSTGVVALTQFFTKNQIQRQEQLQLQATLDQIIPHNLYDNDLFQSCIWVNNPALGSYENQRAYLAQLNGETNVIAIETMTTEGYNGIIKIVVGIKQDGTITGSRILSHQETPGLGDKIDIRISNWITDFSGEKLTPENESSWKVRKDGGKFDQFTGATITPRAVVKSIKNTLDFVSQNREQIIYASSPCQGDSNG